MNTESLDRLERLFRAALLHPPEERAGFLDAACADNPALRAEVESLLQHHDAATAFLEPLDPASALADVTWGKVEEIFAQALEVPTDQRTAGKKAMNG